MVTFSVEEYCKLAIPTPGPGYAAFSPALLAAEKAVSGQDASAAYALNRNLCRHLLARFRPQDGGWGLPTQLHSLYEEHITRIAANAANKPDEYFSLANDPFCKDLAILRHRLLPFGAELATPFAGIPRQLLIKHGWRQAIHLFRTVIECRGFRPLLELHMHPDCTDHFHPTGWLTTYENLADFLELNSAFLGVQSTSWFLDPALETISPHLCYLRKVPEHCGAVILYVGEDEPTTSGALATSQTRRDLLASGRYHPKLFTRIWPRSHLLKRHWRSFQETEFHH